MKRWRRRRGREDSVELDLDFSFRLWDLWTCFRQAGNYEDLDGGESFCLNLAERRNCGPDRIFSGKSWVSSVASHP